MRTSGWIVHALAACASLAAPLGAAQREPTADIRAAADLQPRIDASIARGVMFLLRAQQRDGSWGSTQVACPAGATALSVHALLHAGLPASHPSIVRALRYLDPIVPADTYSAGLALLALDALGDPMRRERMRPVARFLIDTQKAGRWSYPLTVGPTWEAWSRDPGEIDLSNTMYAALGLRAAARAGVDVPPRVAIELLDAVGRHQEPPRALEGSSSKSAPLAAGFGYRAGDAPRGSMTAAGVASLAVARELLGGKLSAKQRREVERSIDLGVEWLARHFAPSPHPSGEKEWVYYWLYNVERVAGLLALDALGSHDWYREGALWILDQQLATGAWDAGAGAPVRPMETDTCFALLFLRRATALGPRRASSDVATPAALGDGDVWLRASGNGKHALWIAGFGAEARERCGLAADAPLRVARVEYAVDGVVGERVDADRDAPWTDENFAVELRLPYPGEHDVVARATLIAAAGGEVVLDSPAVRVRSEGLVEPWMLEIVDRRARNALAGRVRSSSASSTHGDGEAWRALDGVESTRWMCASDDREPTLALELERPTPAARLVLNGHCATPAMRGEHDVIERVAVRVDRAKTWIELDAPADELAPIVIDLPANSSVQRVEIRIVARRPGTKWPGHAGLTEIELAR